jgi:hypothetical protein
LKSFITLFGGADKENCFHIMTSGCDIGRDIFDQIQKSKTNGKFKAEFVKNVEASNCLTVEVHEKCQKENEKWVVLVKSGFEESLETYLNLEKEFNGKVRLEFIKYDELGKVDGCLTCCSVLF